MKEKMDMKSVGCVFAAIFSVAMVFAGLPEGMSWETAAIQAQIDAAAAKGGGRVTIARGIHPSRTLYLKNGVELHLEKGAVLMGGSHPEDYDDALPIDQIYTYSNAVPATATRKAFIFAEDVEDIAITGEGVIDLHGQAFFDPSKKFGGGWAWAKPPVPRPRMVIFLRCRNVRFEDVTLKDCPLWTMWLRFCDDVIVSRIRIEAEQKMINSDGIDFDGCRHVRVGDSFFKTGDDCVVLRAIRDERRKDQPVVTEDVVVSNCVFNTPCQGVRIGCPSDDTVRNAVFRNIIFKGNNAIGSEQPKHYLTEGDNGYLKTENILFENWKIECTGHPLEMFVDEGIALRGFGGMTFRDFMVNSRKPFVVKGNVLTPIRGMKFERIRGSIAGDVPLVVTNAPDVVFEDVNLSGEVKVSSFGYDPVDSTRFIQAALDSVHPKIVLDRQAGPWCTLPLKGRSNKEFVLEPGVELVAKRGAFLKRRDYLFELSCVTNFTLRGGEGSVFRMWKEDYRKPPYERGEWRYTFRIERSMNVLVENMCFVESGGDGIVVCGNSKNVTIRNCVCDRNHRQGMTVGSGENILVENCIFSNTSGTAPEAGVDFEPDSPNEKLVNCTLRNCLSKNNKGNGYEIYLNQLDENSMPVSIAFENCRTVGNRRSVYVSGGASRESRFVKGFVKFTDCTFESAQSAGVSLSAIPNTAFDVSFTGCVISNIAPENAQAADVRVGAARIVQGPCDGIDFGELTVYQPIVRDWFTLGLQTVGVRPRRISGNVTVISSDGNRVRTVLDADWVAKNMPVINGDKELPARVAFSGATAGQVYDAAHGEVMLLQPVTLVGGGHYLFFVEKPGRVTFSGRQINLIKGRPFGVKPMKIVRLGTDGRMAGSWQIPIPGEAATEFGFMAPKTGLYRLTVECSGTRFLLEKSSVPVAIDTTQGGAIMAARSGSPFSLWLDVPAQTEFAVVLAGDSYNRFKVTAVDPSGRTVFANDMVKGGVLVNGSGDASTGTWRFDFERAVEPHYEWIRIDCFGVPGAFFLSQKKWSIR